ncbi:ABC transporter ATP-binding protein (plasmid) [Nitratireductor rhodophyticola]|uniref:ABC transporter ATP-binding protein n=1 Tax=Nitratireductor rhodophyticola TaxID=2854036 RepID=UPI002AC98B88|nr:ABC transporter ATP-binding protein [Nitratireductor rhodophyticola]WPZ16550.1 ABC transporter ATP-binding protein [Nitratireductor rhodophyticola]
MSALEMRNVGVTLGETAVLDDVSLHVGQGEFVSILGPSGAGKSTLFRLLTGALTPDRGEILRDCAPLKRDGQTFAFMPQRDALMPWRRIVDNVILGLEVQGVPRAEARARALPLFAEFGLEGFEQRYPAELSGGMRQRAALLRTVIQARPIQLLDEPFGALDALTRAQMQRWLEDRWRAARWTTLLVTHDVREAVALSDRIYVLSRRPARVISEVVVHAPRPRLGAPLPDEARALEEDLLNTLLSQTGERP